MDKKELEKNILDLEYKKQLQLLNTSLISGTTGLIPLLISFVWYPDRILIGLSLTFFMGSLSYIWYKNTTENLKEISEKIRKL